MAEAGVKRDLARALDKGRAAQALAPGRRIALIELSARGAALGDAGAEVAPHEGQLAAALDEDIAARAEAAAAAAERVLKILLRTLTAHPAAEAAGAARVSGDGAAVVAAAAAAETAAAAGTAAGPETVTKTRRDAAVERAPR